jgi:hypothetical protein
LLSARSFTLVDMPQQAEAETYPLRRSFLEERLGRAVGIVQFDSQRLEETASATTLAGVLITASNAPIGTLEFDTLTVLLQRYGSAACPDSKQIEFSLYEVLRELGITPGTYQRRDLVQALVRLYQVSVTLPEFDAHTGEPVGVRERRLFGELAVRAEASVIKKVIRERRLSVDAISGGATGGAYVVLADWLAAAVRDRHGVSLDLEAQRRLTGTAKTVWVALELLPYIQDLPNEVEHHTLLLTDVVYEGLKLKARRRSDNRRTLQEAIDSIRAADPTYRTLDISPCAHDKRMRELAIERWIGDQRQCRLRARSQARATPPSRTDRLPATKIPRCSTTRAAAAALRASPMT